MPPELGPGYELVMELASLQDGRRLARFGSFVGLGPCDQCRSYP